MWIKNEYGHLLNLTHAHILRVVVAHDEHYVQARFGSYEHDYADLTRAKGPEEATQTLERISQALAKGEEFLDMMHPYTPVPTNGSGTPSSSP